MGAIWRFLNSPIAALIVTTLVGKLFEKKVKSVDRRSQILAYADAAFLVAERLPLPGKEKYLTFLETVINALRAAGQPELSAQEMQLLQNLAATKSILVKKP